MLSSLPCSLLHLIGKEVALCYWCYQSPVAPQLLLVLVLWIWAFSGSALQCVEFRVCFMSVVRVHSRVCFTGGTLNSMHLHSECHALNAEFQALEFWPKLSSILLHSDRVDFVRDLAGEEPLSDLLTPSDILIFSEVVGETEMDEGPCVTLQMRFFASNSMTVDMWRGNNPSSNFASKFFVLPSLIETS